MASAREYKFLRKPPVFAHDFGDLVDRAICPIKMLNGIVKVSQRAMGSLLNRAKLVGEPAA